MLPGPNVSDAEGEHSDGAPACTADAALETQQDKFTNVRITGLFSLSECSLWSLVYFVSSGYACFWWSRTRDIHWELVCLAPSWHLQTPCGIGIVNPLSLTGRFRSPMCCDWARVKPSDCKPRPCPLPLAASIFIVQISIKEPRCTSVKGRTRRCCTPDDRWWPGNKLFWSQLSHYFVVWFQASGFPSLGLSFLVRKIRGLNACLIV